MRCASSSVGHADALAFPLWVDVLRDQPLEYERADVAAGDGEADGRPLVDADAHGAAAFGRAVGQMGRLDVDVAAQHTLARGQPGVLDKALLQDALVGVHGVQAPAIDGDHGEEHVAWRAGGRQARRGDVDEEGLGAGGLQLLQRGEQGGASILADEVLQVGRDGERLVLTNAGDDLVNDDDIPGLTVVNGQGAFDSFDVLDIALHDGEALVQDGLADAFGEQALGKFIGGAGQSTTLVGRIGGLQARCQAVSGAVAGGTEEGDRVRHDVMVGAGRAGVMSIWWSLA
nr:hypothetical protein CFP56_04530 [Quercus suber]